MSARLLFYTFSLAPLARGKRHSRGPPLAGQRIRNYDLSAVVARLRSFSPVSLSLGVSRIISLSADVYTYMYAYACEAD